MSERMNNRIEAFREAREEFERRCPFAPEERDDYHALLQAMEDASRPEHVVTGASDFMSDLVICSCGWKSESYWDGMDFAQEAWREHVAGEFGLVPQKCACGKVYVPADGGVPCHELKAVGRTSERREDARYSNLSGRERREAIRESNQRAGGDYYGG